MLYSRTFNIVFIGDVVSKIGMQVLTEKLPTIIQEHQIDFIIVNGENTTNGRSLS